jgi:hypothetical protein
LIIIIGSHVTHHYCAAGAVNEFFNGILNFCNAKPAPMHLRSIASPAPYAGHPSQRRSGHSGSGFLSPDGRPSGMILAGRGFALSWVNDLSSILGIPKGAATLAAAIYVGSAKGAWPSLPLRETMVANGSRAAGRLCPKNRLGNAALKFRYASIPLTKGRLFRSKSYRSFLDLMAA